MVSGAFHGIPKKITPRHEACRGQDPLRVRPNDGLVYGQRQPEIVAGNDDFFQNKISVLIPAARVHDIKVPVIWYRRRLAGLFLKTVDDTPISTNLT